MISLPKEKLKQLITSEGLILPEAFDRFLSEAERKGVSVVDILVAERVITKEYFYMLLSKSLGIPRIHLEEKQISEEVLCLLPQEIARDRRVIVFDVSPDGTVHVAMEDPTNLETIDFLSLRLRAPVKAYLATDEDLNSGFLLYEKRLAQGYQELIEESVRQSLKAKARGNLQEAASELPVVELLNNLLSYGISLRASDIHFEVLEETVLVRFRIDGVLREMVRMPKEIHPSLIARIKILSGLRVDEHSRPQDGRFRYRAGSAPIDVRISTIPTFYGEKAVLRLLVDAMKPVSLTDLGMLEDHITLIQNVIARSFGMFLVCGPTGSGKTTTLYSLLNIVNHPEINIVTVEDPIEYDMRYVNQIQVNPAAGITFASGLRSIFRQDPDIIMVGEIRDNETADIAIQAALTGHMVLSSLHTNDSPTAIPRLMDMAVQPFLIAATLGAVSSQRLARRIHLRCIESYSPEEGVLQSIRDQFSVLGVEEDRVRVPTVFYRGKGCNGCGYRGYSGRVGVFEVLNVSEGIKREIVSPDFTLGAVRALARKEGMMSMFEDGLRKVELGLTTIEEVFRVIRE